MINYSAQLFCLCFVYNNANRIDFIDELTHLGLRHTL